MENLEDVERLFSWLKAPMVHYREFAPHREVADAVATWPVAHRAAVQTGIAAENEPAPQGDSAAKERISRDRRSIPGPMAQPAHPDLTDAATSDSSSGDRSAAAYEKRGDAEQAEHNAQSEDEIPVAATAITGFEEPPATAATTEPMPSERRAPAQYYPAREREALFAGEYRGREREARPDARIDRRDRSLDAVFSRLSGTRDRLPDPRTRARTSPGLGPVFGRLR